MNVTSDPVVESTPPGRSAAGRAHLFVAGVGSVGGALLRQVSALPAGKRPRLVGACTSRRSVWKADGHDPETLRQALTGSGAATDWPRLLRRLEDCPARPLVFVDATGSHEVAAHYERLLRAGVHVATPSKLAFAQAQARFDALWQAADAGGAHLRHEPTAGAGLPVVQTLRDLVATGDRIREIRGAVSGTLTFLFAQVRRGTPFSDAVREAIQRGYAEPDVRDDLSGEDVARKFLILARTAGVRLERGADVHVESLVPEALRAGSVGAFLERLPAAVDARWRTRAEEARNEQAALQYVGRLAGGQVHVGVQAVPAGSPFGTLGGTDNLFEIHTDRYDASPLSVRGPGAGPDVTAGGVLADVLKMARAAV